MLRKHELMRIEACVGSGSGERRVEREQFVQQSCSAAPMPDEKERRLEIELVDSAPVDPILEHRQRGLDAAGRVEAQFERAPYRIRMAAADTAPCGEIQIECRP